VSAELKPTDELVSETVAWLIEAQLLYSNRIAAIENRLAKLDKQGGSAEACRAALQAVNAKCVAAGQKPLGYKIVDNGIGAPHLKWARE
jgi:hypothetical protein